MGLMGTSILKKRRSNEATIITRLRCGNEGRGNKFWKPEEENDAAGRLRPSSTCLEVVVGKAIVSG